MKTTLALALMGAALISVPAMAQTSGTADTTRANTTATAAQNTGASPLYEMKAGQWRATKLTGLNVYDPKNEKIGDINELIIGRDGRVAAVVVGTGGFLGIGEHNSAIPFDQVQWVDEPRDRTVAGSSGAAGGNTTGTTTGSGTSTSTPAPAAAERADRAAERADRAADKAESAAAGASDATTPPSSSTATADRPAATTTTADRAADRRDARDAYRGYPDHAVVNMTKDQLKALPEIRYTR
jgi:sporulation protein YlmC with PRC-barrel domain